jgi:hypothetical protein
MSKYLWIVLDPDSNNSPEFFITEAEAIIAANAAAEDYNDGEWSDGVENIVVARITQKSTKIPLPYGRNSGRDRRGPELQTALR